MTPVPTGEREGTVKAHLTSVFPSGSGVRDRTSAALWVRTHLPEEPDAPAPCRVGIGGPPQPRRSRSTSGAVDAGSSRAAGVGSRTSTATSSSTR